MHSSRTTSYAWDDGSGAGLKGHISSGRLIIVSAGNSILNKSILFQVESEVSYPIPFEYSSLVRKNGYYHEYVNHVNYKKLLQEKLIPNLESKSVIVANSADDDDDYDETQNLVSCDDNDELQGDGPISDSK